MKKGILVILTFFCACTTWNLERKLPKDIRAWYDLHLYIMQAHVPDYIHIKKPTEARYFLELPVELQYKYISLFWKIRWVEAESQFKLCVKLANSAFRGEGIEGWRTDRGKMLLMLGQPDDIYQYKVGEDSQEPSFMEGEEEWDGYNKYYQVWIYRYGRGFWISTASFTFEYDALKRWRFMNIWKTEQLRCRDYYQEYMSPLYWEIWQEETRR